MVDVLIKNDFRSLFLFTPVKHRSRSTAINALSLVDCLLHILQSRVVQWSITFHAGIVIVTCLFVVTLSTEQPSHSSVFPNTDSDCVRRLLLDDEACLRQGNQCEYDSIYYTCSRLCWSIIAPWNIDFSRIVLTWLGSSIRRCCWCMKSTKDIELQCPS